MVKSLSSSSPLSCSLIGPQTANQLTPAGGAFHLVTGPSDCREESWAAASPPLFPGTGSWSCRGRDTDSEWRRWPTGGSVTSGTSLSTDATLLWRRKQTWVICNRQTEDRRDCTSNWIHTHLLLTFMHQHPEVRGQVQYFIDLSISSVLLPFCLLCLSVPPAWMWTLTASSLMSNDWWWFFIFPFFFLHWDKCVFDLKI